MDITLAKTFLEVLTSGNFHNASRRLFVSQSAVSLRIKKLEEELGREVFFRDKSGTRLTPAGEQFERFARSMVKLWEEAQYQVAVPEGLDSILLVGCQYSLWPRLGIKWLSTLETELTTTSIRAEVGMPDRLLRLMLDGLCDIALMYTPQLRPGLEVKPLFQDNLVLAATDPDYPAELDERYVTVEWSPEFVALHSAQFPNHTNSRISLALGTLSDRYVILTGKAAYFPARAIEEFVAAGQLHIISDAPVFPFPAYAVWNPDKDPKIVGSAMELLEVCIDEVDSRQHDLMSEAGVENFEESLINPLVQTD